jgi:hypothetical protein
MKEIKTEIIIDATAQAVWEKLVDLDNYHTWNPFITRASGNYFPSSKINITIALGDKEQKFKPKVGMVVTNKYFEWRGSLPIPGLFIGNHYFQIEKLADGKVKLIHGERFKGLLCNAVFNKIGKDTEDGFKKMNEALKKQLEKKNQ